MLVDFSPDGKVSFTRNPVLLRLFPEEHKRVTRMSEIKFSEDRQLYYIEILTGFFKNYTLGHGPLGWRAFDLTQEFVDEHSPDICRELIADTRDTNQWFFHTYEGAVQIEVAFVEFLREQGIAIQ